MKSFGQAVFLKTHMISTLGRKCANVQNVEIHLVENLHLLSHYGDEPHQCKERGKSFINVGELKKAPPHTHWRNVLMPKKQLLKWPLL